MWAAAGLWAGILLAAFNLYAAVTTYIPQHLVRNDFRLIYGAALNGWPADGRSRIEPTTRLQAGGHRPLDAALSAAAGQ